ncbi:MAG: hypothetical protein HY851_04250 [candidate division Zixibacteria bacterium]|nr:hypothetical protein [candidate division Zixibacteria bacterium]
MFRNVLVPLTVVLLSVSNIRAATGSVTLRSGEKLDRVNLVVDAGSGVLTVHGNGWVRQFKPHDIIAVTDTSGRNITADIFTNLGRSDLIDSLKLIDSDSLASLESQSRVHRRPYGIGLGVAGILNLPQGEFYTDFEGGAGFAGDVRIPASRSVALKLMVLRGGASSRGNFAFTRGFLALELHRPCESIWKSRSIWYFDAGLGVSVGNKPRATWAGGSYKKLGSSRFAVVGGFGMLLLLIDGIALDLSGNMDLLFGDGVINGTDMGLKVGIAVLSGARYTR